MRRKNGDIHIRLPSEIVQALEYEAAKMRMPSKSFYVEHLIRNRKKLFS